MPYRSVFCLTLGLLAAAGAAQAQDLKRGAYLASIMDCSGCHNTGALTGKPDGTMHLAGSTVGFQIPGVGIVYPPNLTPDAETGLGKWTDQQMIAAFFKAGRFRSQDFENRQIFDFEGVKGRLLSSSYTPEPGHPAHQPMLDELAAIVRAHQVDGHVAFEYDTNVYYGQL